MDASIIERLKKEIGSFGGKGNPEDVGIVRTVGDGIVEIEGLDNASMSEMLVFDEASISDVKGAIANDDALYGVILNLEEDTVKAIILGDSRRIKEGMIVKRTKRL